METDNHCMYVLECKDGTYYTGYTNNLHKRVEKHQNGRGAKYTRGRTPVKLIYHEMFSTKREAMQAEYQFKQLSRQEKEQYMFKGAENIE
ncbi:GIY-YIG nuclease family protein [Bacillus tianshenii]|nr:GIY-YIG nuclease family protein [Bacillus tianshenii]